MEGGGMKNEQRTPLFFFFFFFGHLLTPLRFVWGVPKWKFLPGKNRKMLLLPL